MTFANIVAAMEGLQVQCYSITLVSAKQLQGMVGVGVWWALLHGQNFWQYGYFSWAEEQNKSSSDLTCQIHCDHWVGWMARDLE